MIGETHDLDALLKFIDIAAPGSYLHLAITIADRSFAFPIELVPDTGVRMLTDVLGTLPIFDIVDLVIGSHELVLLGKHLLVPHSSCSCVPAFLFIFESELQVALLNVKGRRGLNDRELFPQR